MKIAYFTAGTMGAGHLVRAMAIERALDRRGFTGEYQAWGPPLPFPILGRLGYHVVDVADTMSRERGPDSKLAVELLDYDPDLLIVDMTWMPLYTIGPLVEAERWLIARTCPRVWFAAKSLYFPPEHLERIVAIEPVEHELITHTIDPIVMTNPNEVRPRAELAAYLGVDPSERIAVAAHAGAPTEIDRLGFDGVHRTDLHSDNPLFPASDWLPNADELHLGGGYNSVWESVWLGYYDRSTFTPFQRGIDDQAWRIEVARAYVMDTNGADTLAGWITGQ